MMRLFLAVLLAAALRASRGLVIRKPGRVVAVGDLHGDLDATIRTLRTAGLIDDEQHWAGGDTTLVQLGDVLDRGDSERECWALLRKLTAEAPESGGRVVCLLGNHEVMNVLGEAGPFIHARGRSAFGPCRATAWAPGGPLATEMSACPVVAIVGDSVFVHATLPVGATHESIEQLNNETRRWLLGARRNPPATLLGGQDSPVWDRRLSSPSGVEPHIKACEALQATLDQLGTVRVVVGHTPQRHVNSACNGAVWRCDTGMSRWVVGGQCEALEVNAGDVRILIPEERAETSTATANTAPLAQCDDDGCSDVFWDYL